MPLNPSRRNSYMYGEVMIYKDFKKLKQNVF